MSRLREEHQPSMSRLREQHQWLWPGEDDGACVVALDETFEINTTRAMTRDWPPLRRSAMRRLHGWAN